MYLQITFLCSISIKDPAYLTALSTIVLTIITGFYAYSSHKMLKLSKEKHRPYIAIDKIKYNSDYAINSLIVALKNYGEIPAFIVRSKLDYNEEFLYGNIKFDKDEIIAIPPGQNAIEYQIISSPNADIISQTRIYEYTIEYRSTLKDSILYRTKYQFILTEKNKKAIIITNIEMI